MGPEPDQPTPTPSSDQTDSDNTAATTHNSHTTGKKRKKDEIEDVLYTWSDTEKDQLKGYMHKHANSVFAILR